MLKKSQNRSVFLILLSIFIAVITPLYILGYGIYQWGYGLTTNAILESLDSRSRYFMTTFENEIIRIQEQQYECANNDDISYLVNAMGIMSKHQSITTMLRVQKDLLQMKNSSNYIEEVCVWMPKINRMISTKTGVEPVSPEWQEFLKYKSDISDGALLFIDNSIYLCSTYPAMRSSTNNTPVYVVVSKISTNYIRQQLMDFNLYEDGGTTLTHLDKGFEITVGSRLNIEKCIEVDVISDHLNMKLFTYVSKEVTYAELYRYRNLFFIFTGVSFVMIAAYLFSANRFVSKPVKILVNSFKQLEHGKLDIRIKHKSSDEFGYLYSAFNSMAGSLQEMIELNYKQRILTSDAELRQLQAQINPHFLYNSYFILYRMAKDEDYENITTFLTYLSEYYRYITRNAQMEVNLVDEVTHAYGYAQIQLMRFKKRLTINLQPLPKEYEQTKVPRLILQPLLENAFNHGLKDVSDDGRVDVWFEEEHGKLVFKVQDNGEGMDDATKKAVEEKMHNLESTDENTGIININKRLQLKYGKEYGLRITQPEAGGICMELLLPKINYMEES